jgi:hypothetical protein
MKLTSLSAARGRRERRLVRHGEAGRTGSQLHPRSWEMDAGTFWNPKIRKWGFPWAHDAPQRWPTPSAIYESPALRPFPPATLTSAVSS